jgi:hypothetical protein
VIDKLNKSSKFLSPKNKPNQIGTSKKEVQPTEGMKKTEIVVMT